MKDKINVAELLKDCPKGMVLDCTMLDNVVFEKIDTGSPFHPIIIRRTDTNKTIHLTKYGQYSDEEDYKCIIFPKGKTTWEGFLPPCKFKDGDIVTTIIKKGYVFYSIYKNIKDKEIMTYMDYCPNEDRIYNFNGVLCFANEIVEQRFATEEEKQKLFYAIKDHGYKWNEETKTLEKLIVPNFKVGDKIKNKDTVLTIRSVEEKSYIVEDKPDNFGILMFSQQDKWELVPNKFDINTLKPYDKVLVRGNVGQKWIIDFFGFMDNDKGFPFVCVGHYVTQCIPYEGNEHLLGTTDDCEDYYKAWE